jgi:bifunctional UDP-N-acetylglucosamine pyrophosphorylase/glucosamine-1-phosphate N-acetyltransferase
LNNVRAIVLAAGKGTRMKSRVAKVFHELCGRPLLWWVLRALRDARVEEIDVVISPDMQEVFAAMDTGGAKPVVQLEQLGTAHAVKAALDAMPSRPDGAILVANGDMPLVTADVFATAVNALGERAMSMVTLRAGHDSNFGRIVRSDGRVVRIVEVRDATPEELSIDEVNAGLYVIDEAKARKTIVQIGNQNAQREYYLTDLIALLAKSGEHVEAVRAGNDESLLGINDRFELAKARAAMNERLCVQFMRDGVTIVDPPATSLEPELSIGRDTVIYPHTTISRLTRIGEGCTIGPGCRLSNATIGDRVEIRESVILDSRIGDDVHVGPFAHVRGGTVLERSARIGNFVEVKNSQLGVDAKAAHLSYIGDASVGDESNVGAGTITCNYDGKRKNRTTIGKRVMIGSNTSLIAPVEVGDDALTGAGSVVNKDVPKGGRVAGNPAKPLPEKIKKES